MVTPGGASGAGFGGGQVVLAAMLSDQEHPAGSASVTLLGLALDQDPPGLARAPTVLTEDAFASVDVIDLGRILGMTSRTRSRVR